MNNLELSYLKIKKNSLKRNIIVKKKFKKNNDFIYYSEWKETVLTTKATIKDVLKNLNNLARESP